MTTTTPPATPPAPPTAADLVPHVPDHLRPVLTGEVVAAPSAIPTRQERADLFGLANALAESGILGKHLNGRPGAVAAVVLKGRELGLTPMTALTSIYIIEGMPSLASGLRLALIRREGHDVWWEKDGTDGEAVICAQRLRRDGSYSPHVARYAWTLDMARQAGLMNKDNWKHYPAAMLRARAITALATAEFSDVFLGAVYSYDELGATVHVDNQGNETVQRLPSQAEARAARDAVVGEDTSDASPAGTAPLPEDADAPRLHPDTIEHDPEEAVQVVLDRDALWAELEWQAEVLGRTPTQLATRWIRANKRNVEDATAEELEQILEPRRADVATEAAKKGLLGPGAPKDAAPTPEEPAPAAAPAEPPPGEAGQPAFGWSALCEEDPETPGWCAYHSASCTPEGTGDEGQQDTLV